VWPQESGAAGGNGTLRKPGAVGFCKARKRLRVRVHVPRGAKVRSIRATLAGKKVKIVKRGRARYAAVDLRRVRGSSARLTIKVRLARRTLKSSRVYRGLCPY
jgi:hypothetical protein